MVSRYVKMVGASDLPRNCVRWRYLLARESDIAQAKGSWEALKGLGTA